jgi:hypothetical protein
MMRNLEGIQKKWETVKTESIVYEREKGERKCTRTRHNIRKPIYNSNGVREIYKGAIKIRSENGDELK